MSRTLLLISLLMTGCSSAAKSLVGPMPGGSSLMHTAAGQGADPMLSWIGGLSILAGVAALVMTRGAMGSRALLVGIGLVLVNVAIARYGDWLFIPTLAATGAVSVAYGYSTVRKVLRHRKENGK